MKTKFDPQASTGSPMKSSILQELDARGLIFQKTHDELDDALAAPTEPLTLYCGFDPSGDSLHVGSLLPICALAHFRRHGHRPMALVGGATGLIGDPSGKSDERNLLDEATINHNVEGIGKQLRTILDRAMEMHVDGLGDALTAVRETETSAPIPLLNNADWMKPWSFLDFLRDIGKHFRVNAMLQKDSVKDRLAERESGLSYTEFSYMLIQGYDFLHLKEQYDCALQIGGSDQWGNITAGTELIRRKLGKPAFGLTLPLLTTADGKKFGKTEKGAVWLDANRTSPYEFYQYWARRADSEMSEFLHKFTLLPLEEVDRLAGVVARGENKGQVQRELAYQVTWLVHGREAADQAQEAATRLFAADGSAGDASTSAPSSNVARDRLVAGINIVDLLVETGLQSSKGAARKLVEQGGAYVNEARIEGIDHRVTLADVDSDTIRLRAGKRNYHIINVT